MKSKWLALGLVCGGCGTQIGFEEVGDHCVVDRRVVTDLDTIVVGLDRMPGQWVQAVIGDFASSDGLSQMETTDAVFTLLDSELTEVARDMGVAESICQDQLVMSFQLDFQSPDAAYAEQVELVFEGASPDPNPVLVVGVGLMDLVPPIGIDPDQGRQRFRAQPQDDQWHVTISWLGDATDASDTAGDQVVDVILHPDGSQD